MYKSILAFIFILIITVACLNYSNTSEVNFTKIDYILVEKEKRKLTIFRGNDIIKSYKIALGHSHRGHKEKEGDGRTPEGIYYIEKKNPRSSYYLSLKISYPNEKDRLVASQNRVSPGGDVMIHGIRNGLGWLGKLHNYLDWTRGCIAVTNQEIGEIYNATNVGTRIEIRE